MEQQVNETLAKIDYIGTPSEPCVYTKLFEHELVIVEVYVDDIIVFYSSDTTFENVKNYLSK